MAYFNLLSKLLLLDGISLIMFYKINDLYGGIFMNYTLGKESFFAHYKVDYINSSPTQVFPNSLRMYISKKSFSFYDIKVPNRLILYIPHNKIKRFLFVPGTGLRIAKKGLFRNINGGFMNSLYNNEIQIDYLDEENRDSLLHIGMANSILVNQRKNACLELADLMKTYGIEQEFLGNSVSHSDILSQIRELSDLYQAGILTETEFEAKKAELLRRI